MLFRSPPAAVHEPIATAVRPRLTHPHHHRRKRRSRRSGDRGRMPSARPAVLLVAALCLWWSATGALADGGNGTVCMCTGPQCVPPCPVPGTPPTTSPTQFPFCPASPRSGSGFPQDAGFLAAAAASPARNPAAWLAVAALCSAFLLLLH